MSQTSKIRRPVGFNSFQTSLALAIMQSCLILKMNFMKHNPSFSNALSLYFVVCLAITACGGSSGESQQIQQGSNPIYILNCLERYEKIEQNMAVQEVYVILDKPTYENQLNGNLLGADWNNLTYAGQPCTLLIRFDKKGVYTKGVTDMTGKNADFESRFHNFRNNQGF